MNLQEWLAFGVIMAGLLFFAAGSIGLLRLRDPLSRLHALTKADNLGLLLVSLGLLVWNPDLIFGLKLALIWMLVLAAGTTGAHLIAKRAVRGDGEDAR
jgi:multicomponent Na+:H+ antiporter subunit G